MASAQETVHDDRVEIEPYDHDCKNCVWVGWHYVDTRRLLNVYLCGKTVSIRYGDEPWACWSATAGKEYKKSYCYSRKTKIKRKMTALDYENCAVHLASVISRKLKSAGFTRGKRAVHNGYGKMIKREARGFVARRVGTGSIVEVSWVVGTRHNPSEIPAISSYLKARYKGVTLRRKGNAAVLIDTAKALSD